MTVLLRPVPLNRPLTDDIDERTTPSGSLDDSMNIRPDPCDLQFGVACTAADAEDPSLRGANGLAMPPEPELDPDVVVEGLFDVRSVDLPECDHLEPHRAQGTRNHQPAEAAVDEEIGELIRRLRASASRRHG
jgi:hypothetical protein